MNLFSGLLDHMPPTIAGVDKPAMPNHNTLRARLVLGERPPCYK